MAAVPQKPQAPAIPEKESGPVQANCDLMAYKLRKFIPRVDEGTEAEKAEEIGKAKKKGNLGIILGEDLRVITITNDTPAYQRLFPDDLIVKVDDQPVKTKAEYEEALSKNDSVTITFIRPRLFPTERERHILVRHSGFRYAIVSVEGATPEAAAAVNLIRCSSGPYMGSALVKSVPEDNVFKKAMQPSDRVIDVDGKLTPSPEDAKKELMKASEKGTVSILLEQPVSAIALTTADARMAEKENEGPSFIAMSKTSDSKQQPVKRKKCCCCSVQ